MIRVLRPALGLAGIGLLGYGVHRVRTGGLATDPRDLARWLVGGVLAHDLVIAGLTAGAGWLLARTVPAAARPAVQGGLLVAGSLVLVALPVLSGRGGHGNATVNPLDYPRNLGWCLLAVAAGTATVAFGRCRRPSPGQGTAGTGSRAHPVAEPPSTSDRDRAR